MNIRDMKLAGTLGAPAALHSIKGARALGMASNLWVLRQYWFSKLAQVVL